MKKNNDFNRSQIKDEIMELLSDSVVPNRRWLRTKQAMSYLDISLSQIESLKTRKKLPFTKLGGIVYFDREDLDQLLVKNKRNISVSSDNK